jgi:hypothetical protein
MRPHLPQKRYGPLMSDRGKRENEADIWEKGRMSHPTSVSQLQ